MEETIKYIEEKICDFKPEIGIILGSGLGDFAVLCPYSISRRGDFGRRAWNTLVLRTS